MRKFSCDVKCLFFFFLLQKHEALSDWTGYKFKKMLIISFGKYDATSFFKSISKTFNKVVANHYLMFLLQNKTKHWNRNLVGEPKDVKLQAMKTHGIIFVKLKKKEKKKCMSTNQ